MVDELESAEIKVFDLSKVSVQTAFDALDSDIAAALNQVNSLLSEGRVVSTVQEIGDIQVILGEAAGVIQALLNEKAKVLSFINEKLPESPIKK